MSCGATLFALVSPAPPLDKPWMQRASDGEPSADRRPAAIIYRAPLFNASETFVRAHALGLKRYRPVLAGLEDKGNIPPELRGSAYLPRTRHQRFRARLGGVGWLADRLRGEKPALIHAHFGPDGLTAADLARRLNVPLVTTLHGYDVSRTRRALLLSGKLSWARYALLREKLIREGALFLAVSEALRLAAIHAGYPAERSITHYLGVDLKAFSPASGDDGRTVLHVGRLVEKKGTAVLLSAFQQVAAANPAAQLVIIGDGPLRGGLQRQAVERGISDRVRFLGSQPPSVVAEWMRGAAVLAVPSVVARDGDAEGLPTVIPEAAASSLVAVGSDHSGIPEAIVDGETGFVVAEGESEALAARLMELLASPELRRSMGAAARALAEARFDRDAQIERLERLYDSLARAAPLTTARL